MIVLSVTCLIGILIGLHYNVLAVIPATLATVLVSYVSAIVNGGAFATVLFGILTSAIGLQAGYMIGLAGRGLIGQLFSRTASAQSKRV
jgi:membrane protein DedA with SNARE-associated domain